MHSHREPPAGKVAKRALKKDRGGGDSGNEDADALKSCSSKSKEECDSNECAWIDKQCVDLPVACSSFLKQKSCETNDYVEDCLWKDEECVEQTEIMSPMTMMPTYSPSIIATEPTQNIEIDFIATESPQNIDLLETPTIVPAPSPAILNCDPIGSRIYPVPRPRNGPITFLTQSPTASALPTQTNDADTPRPSATPSGGTPPIVSITQTPTASGPSEKPTKAVGRPKSSDEESPPIVTITRSPTASPTAATSSPTASPTPDIDADTPSPTNRPVKVVEGPVLGDQDSPVTYRRGDLLKDIPRLGIKGICHHCNQIFASVCITHHAVPPVSLQHKQ